MKGAMLTLAFAALFIAMQVNAAEQMDSLANNTVKMQSIEKELGIENNAMSGEIGRTKPQKERGNLSAERKDWYFKRNNTHTPPEAQNEIDLKEYDSFYLGDVNKKEIYLTFDSGYENGLTYEILDILKEKQVPAAFFVLKSYISKNPELIKRMVDEGHIVANHSTTHKNFSDLTKEQIERELNENAQCFYDVTGKEMPRFFRPPAGVYSERALAYVQDFGYKTVFWSFAYKDWEEDAQPGRHKAYEMMVNNTHNGSIMMLHSVSKSNAEALSDAIDTIREQGYVFKSLERLSY